MAKPPQGPRTYTALRKALLAWYTANRRDLPWRRHPNPYRTWVSEIMLQQTRVAAVLEHFRLFLEAFPDITALASAPEEKVLALWSGLGYYRRARMLHRAAQVVVSELHGRMPQTSEGLRELPGVGRYTAAAIASIAYGEAVAVVDGNVERVLCRLAGWEAGSRKGGGAALRHKIEVLAGRLLDRARPGDFNQAIMELGATVCAPRNPQCPVCPLMADCKTRGEHKTPRRAPMISRAVGYALSVRTESEAGKRDGPGGREVLLEQRPAQQTVMPGMWELPMLLRADVPEKDLRMTVRHAIMQVNYYVRVRTVFEDDIEGMTVEGGERRWVPLREAAGMALTGLARKVLTRAHLLPARSMDSIAPAGKDAP